MTIRHLLLGATAFAALTLAAGASLAQSAGPDDVCLDDGCTMISLFGLPAASDYDSAGGGAGASDSTVAPHFGTWGFDTAGMDASVKPGDDFNRYVNGKAVDAIVIPNDRSRFGSFDILRELSDNRLHALVLKEAGRTDLKPGTDDYKIAALYKAYMDTARIEALDAKPMAADLAAVRAIKTREDVARFMAASFDGLDRPSSACGSNPTTRTPTPTA